MASKQEWFRDRVIKFYEKHREKGAVFTAKHFKLENKSESGIYRIIQRYKNGLGPKRVEGSGQYLKKSTTKKN